MGILGGIFLLFQGVIWIGPPLYAGYSHVPLWFVLVWSAALGVSTVMSGWRYQDRLVAREHFWVFRGDPALSARALAFLKTYLQLYALCV
jgi:hypothetical protein